MLIILIQTVKVALEMLVFFCVSIPGSRSEDDIEPERILPQLVVDAPKTGSRSKTTFAKCPVFTKLNRDLNELEMLLDMSKEWICDAVHPSGAIWAESSKITILGSL